MKDRSRYVIFGFSESEKEFLPSGMPNYGYAIIDQQHTHTMQNRGHESIESDMLTLLTIFFLEYVDID